MDPELLKKEIYNIIHDVPPSQIPLEKPQNIPIIIPNYIEPCRNYWGTISLELIDRYNYGENLGKYGNNTKTIELLYKRLSNAIIDIIKNECAKNHSSSEELQLHFDMINSIMILIGKTIQNKQLNKSNPETILASMQGFINSYINQLTKG
jgi:hypothetical protein